MPAHLHMVSRCLVLAVIFLLALVVTGCGQTSAASPTFARAPVGARCADASAASAAVRETRLLLGTHLTLRGWRAPRQRALSRLACVQGARIAREDLEWSRVQPRRDAPMTWTHTDGMFLSAAKEGLTLLPILNGTPHWAGPTSIGMPLNPERFASFAAAAVARYGPGGSFWRAHRKLARFAPRWWELYNEPYKAAADPAHYARVVRAAARRMRAVDPRAKVLICGETNQVTGGTGPEWVDRMYAAVPDLTRWYDALSVHPYDTGSPLDDRANRPFRSARLEELRAALVAHGDEAKHLWVTEIGWSTCSSSDCASPAQQALYLRGFLRLVRTRWRRFVDAVTIYQLQDGPGPPADKESHYGLLRSDGSPKPAWFVLRRWAAAYATR